MEESKTSSFDVSPEPRIDADIQAETAKQSN